MGRRATRDSKWGSKGWAMKSGVGRDGRSRRTGRKRSGKLAAARSHGAMEVQGMGHGGRRHEPMEPWVQRDGGRPWGAHLLGSRSLEAEGQGTMGPWGQEPLGASKRSGQLGAGVTMGPVHPEMGAERAGRAEQAERVERAGMHWGPLKSSAWVSRRDGP